MQRRGRRESQSEAEVGKDKNIFFTRLSPLLSLPGWMKPGARFPSARRSKGLRACRWETRLPSCGGAVSPRASHQQGAWPTALPVNAQLLALEQRASNWGLLPVNSWGVGVEYISPPNNHPSWLSSSNELQAERTFARLVLASSLLLFRWDQPSLFFFFEQEGDHLWPMGQKCPPQVSKSTRLPIK